MTRIRFVYWAHTNRHEPSRIFKRKRDAIQWGQDVFFGTFIVEHIATAKLAERVNYVRTKLGYNVTTA
jgi:hypothetical protein